MITIFTPTYNREQELSVLYDSLLKQNNMDFFWAVVDDGSQDNTRAFINKIEKTSPFKIIYHYQKNAGKHTAINWLLDNCTTQFAICVDSDDYLSPNAVTVLNEYANKYKQKPYWAIVGPRFSMKEGIKNWNVTMEKSILFSTIYTHYKYKGETFMLWNLDLFDGIRFPIFDGEKFLPESAIYDILDMKAHVIVCNDTIYISDYQGDGLTMNSKSSFVRNRKGYATANLISSMNTNRSIMDRSLSYARYCAIKKRITNNFEVANDKDVGTIIRCVGSAIGIPLSLFYSIQGK